MEDRIKEQQVDILADRSSTSQMANNHFRLWFSTITYLLTRDFRADALVGTQLSEPVLARIAFTSMFWPWPP